ncbi:MAG: LptA/OstA family protein [Candidatus Eremiobacteraeota bacterium]|nr:LptA/OstA family protein [Candidatus Eremiobacteraeota bacterium]
MNKNFLIVAAVAVLAFGNQFALAKNAPPHKPSTPKGAGTTFAIGDYNVNTSALDLNYQNGDFTAPNHVTMTRPDPPADINADRATGNYKRKAATLVGHVVLHDSSGFASLSSAKSEGTHQPATLTTDQLQIDGISKVYVATGSVHFTQGTTVVDADKGTLDDRTHILHLSGNVHITQQARSMNAQTVAYNTISGDAKADGDVTMQFPGNIHPAAATPKPIVIKVPKIKIP